MGTFKRDRQYWITENIFTKRLNPDVLENFFGVVRQQNGNCLNPTPIQFHRSFRKLACNKLLHAGTANCEEDDDGILLKLGENSNKNEAELTHLRVSLTTNTNARIIDTDYQNMDVLEKKNTRYVCGYLMKNGWLYIHAKFAWNKPKNTNI